MTETVLRCPACGRWLGAVGDYARLVCPGCRSEVIYKSLAERRRATAVPIVRATDRPIAID